MASTRNANEVRMVGAARRGRAALALTTALQASAMMVLSLPAMAQPPSLAPNAQPQGGTTVAGSATISQSATTTTINQTSQRAALNWQSFNVGSQQTVNFQQPSSSAVALNRVVGPDPSQIAGRINANGQVVLVNQSGVVFTQGAQVNAAGLLVSTAGISNRNFMAGTMTFDQAGNPNARIENAGNITVKQAGLAALVAPQVANSGTITATLGHVVLAGAKTATLDMYGDGLVALDVTNQVTQVPVAADGSKVTALVTNTGTILAAGGTVQLTARAADGVVQTLVNAGGRIATPSLGTSTGTISLNAIGGTVIVEGQLAATGDTPGSTGGAVGVLATGGVGIASGATIDVSGKAGGGVAAIGTTLARAKGGPSVTGAAKASNVVVQQGATIAANATVKGNGGRVTVLSSNVTRMDGSITAKGGPQGGNGGFVEVSGNTLGVTTGSLDVSAPKGTAGTILFDPIFLDIDNIPSGSGTEDQNFFNNGGTILVGDGKTGAPDTLSANAFGQLSGDVLLEAQQTISVNAGFNVNLGSLTMEAGSKIFVNAGATVSADADVTIQIVPSLGTVAGAPLISILGSVVSNGGAVTLLASPGGSVTIGAAGGVRAEETNITIQADSLTAASAADSIIAAGGSVEIAPATPGTQMTFAGPGGLELTQGFLDALDTTSLRVGAVTLNGTITTTAGTISVASVAALGNTSLLTVNSTGPVTEATGAGLRVGELTGTTGAVGLVGSNNSIALLGDYVANGGDFAMRDISALLVDGNLTATSGSVYLQSSNASGISVGVQLANIDTSATGTASFQTDQLVISQGSRITTGTFELAPDTIGATLEPGNLTPSSLSTITSTFVRLGAVTEPGGGTPTVRAGEVLIVGNFDFLNRGVELDASGPIDVGGGTLTNVATLGGTGTTWTLSATTNTVGNLGSISAGSFNLLDNIVLSVIGTLNATVLADIDNTAGVTVAGAVKAPSISIQGSTLAIAGLVSDGGAGTVNLVSSAGGIDETGSVVAGTLSGNAAGTVTLTGSNTVATLGNFFAPSFTMSDAGDLSVSGASGLQGGIDAIVTDTGTLTVLTTVSANSISLTAGSIAIPGLVTDGGVSGGNVALIATAGGIGETGAISTTTLSGSATGAVTLTGANTVANLGNFTANGFTLADAGDLTIGGSTGVAGGASASIAATGVLSVASTISATSVGLTGSGIFETGTIVAATLSGSATGAVQLTGNNTIAAVGNFTANGFTLFDTGSLGIGGTTGIAATTAADISAVGTLTVTSTVNAATVALSGAAIAIDGVVTDGGAGSVSLTATAGGITETGTMISGNLSGSATGAVTLTGSNTIDNIGEFQANGFTLFDTGDVALNSFLGVDGGPSVTMTDTGTITVYGDVNATAIRLSAAGIRISGTISDGGAGTVALVATAGDVVEPNEEGIPGAVIAGTLTGSATGSVDLEGFNTIAAVGNITATNGFNLNDTIGLAVGGTAGIAGGAYATITTSGSLTVTSGIGGGSVDLTATSMSISGLIGAGTTGPISLIATTGDIAGTGSLVGGSLTGTSAGTTDLTGSSTITTVGSFFAAGFTLNDTGNLSVPGTLEATNGATITDSGTLTIGGSVLASTIGLTGGNLAISGVVSAGSNATLALVATGGTIDETGALTAGTLSGGATGTTKLVGSNTVKAVGNFAGNGVTLDDSVNLAAGTGANGLNGGAGGATIVDSGALTVDKVIGTSINLTANSIAVPGSLGGSTSAIALAATSGGISGAGTVTAASLVGSSTGATILTGTNTIAAVGNFTAAGFTLNDTGNLAIAGTTGVSGGANAAITTTGTLTVTSTVSAATVGLTGGAIAIGGLVTDGGTGNVVLTATAGGIAETGTLVSGNLSGSATGAIALTGSNTVPIVGDVTAAGFTLIDTGNLTVAGTNGVQGGASASITDSGTLSVNTTVSGTAVGLDAAAIFILGLVTDGGAGTVALTATGGSIVEGFGQAGTGRVVAGTLTGSATAAVFMDGDNTIAAVGSFAPDGLSLIDTIGLTVDGTSGIVSGAGVSVTTQGTLTVASAITGTSVDLTATSMSLTGLVGAGPARTLTLTATTGDIAGTGTLVAGTFDGTAVGAVNLTGPNTIATVGDVRANGFTLDDTGNLTVAGSLGIVGGIGATIVDTGTLTVQTGVSAATVALTGANLALPGLVTDGGTGTVGLNATGGTISETGTLIAGTLSGSATGATVLTGSNTIAAIGNFSGNGVTIDDTGNLAAGTGANGLRGGAGGATIVDTGTLTVDGVFGASVNLTGATLAIPGIIGDVGGPASVVTLAATGGGIEETGSIVATLLQGSGAGAALADSVDLTGNNTIASIGNVTAGFFSLNDTGNLAVAGTTGVSAGALAQIGTTGTLTVTSTISGHAILLTGAAIAIDGLVTDGGSGSTSLVATAGGIAETGSLISGNLSGSATGATALTGSNTVGTLQSFSAAGFTMDDTGNLAIGQNLGNASRNARVVTAVESVGNQIVDGGANATIADAGTVTVYGSLAATAVSLNATGIVIEGLVSDGGAGTVTLVAGNGGISESGGALTAGTLSGSTPGTVNLTSTTNSIATLGGFTAGGDLSLIDTLALTVTGLVSAGSPSAPAPANTATLSLTATGGMQLGVSGGASATLNAGTIALTANGAITEPNGALAANDLTAQTNGAGGDITLGSATNRIAASSGIAATNGDVTLIDDPTLVLTGAYSGNNLFFEVNQPGDSIAVGGAQPATLTVPTGGRITLVADGLSATATSTMSAPQGTVQLAPFSAIAETVLGTAATGTLNLDSTLLAVAGAGVANRGTLMLGAFAGTTQFEGGPTETIRATAISIDGTLSLSPTATTLGLLANGPVAESGGAITVAALFGTADGGDFTLASPRNAIASTDGIAAPSGNIVLVDGTDLALTGLQSANNAFFEVAAAGSSLSVGLSGTTSGQVQVTGGGRISLVADEIAATGGSSISASGGTVELAPFSAIDVGLTGTTGPSLLSTIATGTLLVGGFTDAAAGATTPHVSAADVALDGTTDLTGIATTLVLAATGAITQSGGALTVGQLGGTGSSVTLSNAANSIGTVSGLTAKAGDVALADTGTLAVAGAVSATGNVYLTSNAIALGATAQVTAGTTALVSVQANTLTLATGATVYTGTFEFAPLTAGSTLTLGAGGALASLSGIDASLARIGAVTLPGGATPTTVAGAISVGATFDAAGLNVELDATGAIDGAAAPLVDVSTLGGSGGAWNLTAPGNSVATLGAIAASGFQLNDSTALSVAGVVSAGAAAFVTAGGTLTVAAGGTIAATAIGLQANALALAGKLDDGGTGVVALAATGGGISQTGTLIAGTLSGRATGTANFTGSNSVATLGDFAAAGFRLTDTGNLTVGGTGGVTGGGSAAITDTGTLTVASGVSATAVSLTAASLSLTGLVTDGGAGRVNLIATTGGIAQTGTLIAGTLSGSASGSAAFGGTDTVATLGTFTAGSFALTNASDLLIAGTVTAPTLSIHAPNSQITFGANAAIVTGGGNRPNGAIVAADEPANGAPGAYLLSRTFTQTGASFVTGTMQIGVAGTIAFDPKFGLQDQNGWLILNLTSGRATGDIFVRALDVSYTTPGAAVLTGRIDGVGGQSAASLANILPATNLDFTFNGCTIGTVVCTIVTPPPPIATVVQTVQPEQPALANRALVPLLYSLQNVTPQVLLSPQDLDDLLQLPVVSEQDY